MAKKRYNHAKQKPIAHQPAESSSFKTISEVQGSEDEGFCNACPTKEQSKKQNHILLPVVIVFLILAAFKIFAVYVLGWR